MIDGRTRGSLNMADSAQNVATIGGFLPCSTQRFYQNVGYMHIYIYMYANLANLNGEHVIK